MAYQTIYQVCTVKSLPWCLMSITASKVACNSTIYSTVVQTLTTKKTLKFCITDPLWRDQWIWSDMLCYIIMDLFTGLMLVGQTENTTSSIYFWLLISYKIKKFDNTINPNVPKNSLYRHSMQVCFDSCVREKGALWNPWAMVTAKTMAMLKLTCQS